ncbi:aldehyde dehydrogenase [Alphaproteobacteria bacterium]|jgi:4-(gamma-glutamylamino)butanal dehydrogenase|nr:aldehyde dehydrogenase [Alphaproteobacteria bacterium]
MQQADIDLLRGKVIPAQGHFINGKWCAPKETLEITSPIDGKALTTIGRAVDEEVEDAVASARIAFDDGRWSRMAPAGRKKVLHRIADLIEQNALELAVLGVRDNGTEIGMAIKAESGSAAGTFRYYAEAIDKIYGEIAPTADNVLGLIHREPVGVVGAIIPWNFPLMIGAWKVAPALAAGNSIVLKPAEVASLSWLRLTELCAEAGLPDGVLNVVTGKGSTTGEAIALHKDVDVLVFTGSGFVGRKLLEYSARSNLKRVYLELGGKSPNIIFEDTADIEQAAKVAAGGIFRNSGQVCVAGSRILVQSSIKERFLETFVKAAEALKVGDPLDLSNSIGAVTSSTQLAQNLAHVDAAKDEGGVLLTGGNRINEASGGYYMTPTVFVDVKPDMKLATNEVFGPVAAVMDFDDEAEAVTIANGTDYGLAAGVWTADLSRAHRMIRAVKSGVIHVNCYGGADGTVPLGGVKQSGNGVDKSLHAFDKYTDLKTAWIQL